MNLWTRPISSSIRMEHNIEPPVRSFIQAIPIYMARDAAVFEYFKDYKRDIDTQLPVTHLLSLCQSLSKLAARP